MGFPQSMIDEKRWLIRSHTWSGELKRPVSGYSQRPVDYEAEPNESPDFWRFNWDNPAVWMTYAQAVAWVDAHPEDAIDSGLSFVIHPGNDPSRKRRIVLLDFDGAVGDDGEIDETVLTMLELFDGWVEFSRSGRGLHLFLYVDDCPLFISQTRIPLGGCKYDVLLSYQGAVTGSTFREGDLPVVSVDTLKKLPGFDFREKGASVEVDMTGAWADPPLDEIPEEFAYLVDSMEMAPAIEGQGGQKVLFAAACNLMRHAVPFRAAEALLRRVPATPPFSTREIQYVVECAFRKVNDDQEYGAHAFDDLTAIPTGDAGEDEIAKYGFKIYRSELLESMDLRLEWLVEGAFVDAQPLIIGGREKTFKTSIALDLLVALVSGTKFLNRFQCKGRRSSVLFTAEIGIERAMVLQRSIREAKGLNPSDLEGIHIIEKVPNFNARNKNGLINAAAEAGLKKLRLYLKDFRPQVAVFDPLYLALGNVGVGDMYENGAVLTEASNICKEFGTWPIFCHHAKKDPAKDGKPMDLSDLYGSGCGAFARQWLLLSHAEPFRHGVAKLYGNLGGSSQGAGGIWKIEIDEGQPDDIMERKWEVSVREQTDQSGCTDTEIVDTIEAQRRIKLKDLSDVLDVQRDYLKQRLNALIREGSITLIDGFYTSRGL